VGPAQEASPRFTSPEAYTPKHLADQIRTWRSSLEGERKLVTVLFADIRSSLELLTDRDPEDARRLLDAVLEVMMEAVHRYEGTVNQVMGDGIMALFGAPLAHEDHAVRACYAALRMQEVLRRHTGSSVIAQIPVELRIGLNSGEVVVRTINNDLRMDYTAVGQTTHLAARMEQIAKPGTILVTGHTMRLVEGYVDSRSLGPVKVKGLDAPVSVYELLHAIPVLSRFHATLARGLNRFVGRHKELGQLRQALEQAAGRGEVIALVGEPGVGKSRLVLEAVRSPTGAPRRVLEAGAAPYAKSMPFAPVIGLLKAYFEVGERDDSATLQQKVYARLEALGVSAALARSGLLALVDDRADDAAWLQLDPLERRRRTLEAFQALLVEESRTHAVVLVFEDLQWIDSETQGLLNFLVENISSLRILLLVTYRAHYQPSWPQAAAYTEVPIEPLPPQHAAELLEGLLGNDPGLDALRLWLIERADGSPFFLEESVAALVESGLLAGERGAYRLTRPFAGIRVPTTVEALVAARVDRLSRVDKQLLQSAAAIGQDIQLDLLSTVEGLKDDELRSTLARLQHAGFLYETRSLPEVQYRFKHAVTREVVYGALLREQSRALHTRILDAMQRLHPGRLGEKVERFAHHAFRAELWDAAAEYARSAGRRALLASANTEAVQHLEQALVALGHLPQTDAVLQRTVGIRLTLRDALWSLGRIERLREHLHEAEIAARRLDDRRALGRVICYQCHYLWTVGDLDQALAAGDHALTIATALDDALLIAETQLYSGVVFMAQGECERTVQVLEQALLSLARASDPNVGLGRRGIALALLARSFLTRALTTLGRFDEGIAHGETAVRLAEASGTAFARVTALAGLGVLYLGRSESHAAISLLGRALELCRTYSINNWLPTVAATLGAACAIAGRLDESVRLLEEAIGVDTAIGINATLSMWRMHLGDAYLRAGRVSAALEETRRALVECRARKERGYEAWLLHLLGRIQESQAPPEVKEAIDSHRTALQLAERLGMRPLAARCALGLARLSERAGDAGRAADHREQAARVATEVGIPLSLLETS
jgi:class 3 adenylate cyclase/tetratricopeptide (TPR) repeat protein